MALRPLADDTPLDMEARQVEAWRRMTPDEKAAVIVGLTQATFELALAGIAARHPQASPREHFLRRAILLFGRDLAARAYPEIETSGIE